MDNIIIDYYKKIVENVSNIIDISGYRNDFIAKKMGIKPQNFSLKKQRANWTPDEVSTLLKVVENDDVKSFMNKIMKSFSGNITNSSVV